MPAQSASASSHLGDWTALRSVNPAPPLVGANVAAGSAVHPSVVDQRFENRVLTNKAQHTFTARGRDFDPDLHPDGSTLLFASTRNSTRPDIFLKRTEGYAITQLTSDPADDIQPRFSPDGENVVFSSNRSGNWDIWMIRADGTGLVQLTSGPNDEIAPCFSPDGMYIAYTSWGGRSAQWEIWTLSIGNPGMRTFLAYGLFPDWSPVGARIAFQRARQRGSRWFSVWSVELVDGDARRPTEIAHSDLSACVAPRFSPDGRAIVYCALTSATAPDGRQAVVAADVWTVDLKTGLRLKQTDGAAIAFNPVWGSNGRIYYVASRGDAENIWSLASNRRDDLLGPTQDTAAVSRAVINRPVRIGN